MTVSDQKQFTIPGRLLTPDGELSTAGWARQPILDCNLEDAHFYNLGLFQPLRIKRWDYYGITTPDHFFSFTLSDVGYLCMIFAYGIDFTTGKYHEETLTLPLGGHVQLPRNSTEGETSYSNGKVSMRFNVEPGARTLDVRWPGFGGQAFIPAVVEKVKKVKALVGDRPIHIEIDGGVSTANAGLLARTGADVLVAGTSVFKGGTEADYRRNIQALRDSL